MSFIIIIGIIFFIGYYLSLKAHPYTKCRICNGRGRHNATGMYSYAYRRCRKCGGSGRKDRLGVRMFLNRGGTVPQSGRDRELARELAQRRPSKTALAVSQQPSAVHTPGRPSQWKRSTPAASGANARIARIIARRMAA
jgi:hypothetical protein